MQLCEPQFPLLQNRDVSTYSCSIIGLNNDIMNVMALWAVHIIILVRIQSLWGMLEPLF